MVKIMSYKEFIYFSHYGSSANNGAVFALLYAVDD